MFRVPGLYIRAFYRKNTRQCFHILRQGSLQVPVAGSHTSEDIDCLCHGKEQCCSIGVLLRKFRLHPQRYKVRQSSNDCTDHSASTELASASAIETVEDQTPDAESAAYKAHFCSLGSLIPPRYTRKNNFIFSIMTLTGSCMCGGVHYSVEGIQFCSSLPFGLGLIKYYCSGQLLVCAMPLHRLPKGILNTSIQLEHYK